MLRILLIATLVVLSSGGADARHRHHRGYSWGHYSWSHAPRMLMPAAPYARATTAPRSRRDYARLQRGEFPPPDWQLQPADPNWQGRRYVSPTGDAWLALYASPADRESNSAHLQSVAFAEGEDIITLNGDRDGLLVTGARGDRMFLRKARLACGGRQWHHVAIEFPAGAQDSYQLLFAQALSALDLADADGCTTPVAGNER